MKSTGCDQLDGLRFAAVPRIIETWMTFSECLEAGSWGAERTRVRRLDSSWQRAMECR
jgi:hypothetical protein